MVREDEELEWARELTARGDRAFEAENFDLALDCYTQALRIHEALMPESPELATDLENVGLVHRTRGATDLTLTYYRRALGIRVATAPSSVECSRDLARIGTILYTAGDLNEALSYLEPALAIDEAREGDSLTTARDVRNLGLVHYGLGDLDLAEAEFQRALRIRTSLDPSSIDIAASHNDVGLIRRAQSDLEGALESFTRALSVASALDPGSIKTATYLNNVGAVYRQKGELNLALAHYEQTLAISASSGEHQTLMAATLSNIGLIYQARGELDRALSYYERALAIDELERPRSLEMSTDLGNIGSVHQMRGNLVLALSFYERALVISERVSPRSAETATHLGNVASIHRAYGDLDLALSYYDRVLAIREPHAPTSMEMANVLNNIGFAHDERGDLDLALSYYEQALEICEKVAPRSVETATKLNNIASVYRSRGDLDLALSYYERALALDEELAPASAATAMRLGNVGMAYEQQGDFDQALLYLERALAIDEVIAPDSIQTATDLNNIGALHLDQGNLDGALQYFQRALSIDQRAAPDSTRTATDLNNIGFVHRIRGELDSALRCYEQALAIDEASAPSAAGTATDVSNIGFVHLARGDGDLALEYFERAAAVIESLTTRAGDPTARQGVFGRYTYVYGAIVGCLSRRGRPGDDALAFSYAEQSRARALAELMTHRVWRPRDDVDRDLLKTEIKLRHAVAGLHNQVAAERRRGDADSPALAEFRQQELTARQMLSQAQGRLDRARRSVEIRSPTPVDLAAAQGAIDNEQLVLEYVYGVDQVFVFVVTRSSLRLLTLEVTPGELDQQVEEALEPFRRGDHSEDGTSERLRRLRDVLLTPVTRDLMGSMSRVLVVPDGALHSLPFEMLLDVTAVDVASELPAFAYSPSLTIHAMLKAREPVEHDLDFVGFAPQFDSAPGAEGSPDGSLADPAGWRALFGDLGPVVGGRDEVEQLENLLAPRSAAYVDDRATEYQVKHHASRCRYLHIATHGVFEAGDPLFATGLLMSPPLLDEPTSYEHLDDFLQTHEMFDLELRAEVVVLSACQTGLGRHIAGEGVLGMSRALLFAGARCVVASMWPVVNLPTRDLMEAFYAGLQDDLPPVFALRRAKTLVRADHEDPYFWAGFVCIGDAG